MSDNHVELVTRKVIFELLWVWRNDLRWGVGFRKLLVSTKHLGLDKGDIELTGPFVLPQGVRVRRELKADWCSYVG